MKELAERLGASRSSLPRSATDPACADVDNATAGQVLKRLKAEDFVLEQTGTRRQRGKNSTQPESMRAPALCVNKCVSLSIDQSSFDPQVLLAGTRSRSSARSSSTSTLAKAPNSLSPLLSS